MKKYVLLCAKSIAFVMIISLFLMCFPVQISAESMYIRKIVSVVYDDSGSMGAGNSLNWSYASYAMQAFCGLLNSDDRLFITYMKYADGKPNYDPPEVDLSADKIQASVDGIREHIEYGDTPYTAVDVAYNKLKSIDDSNENTQYWLVIITDGVMRNDTTGGTVTKNELDKRMRDITSENMPNGTKPQVTYLAINSAGGSVVIPDNNPNKNIYSYNSTGADDIINVLGTIADKISGRSRLNSTDIMLKDEKTVQITSEVPLMNIAVLSQKTSAKMISAEYSDGKGIKIDRSVSVSYPERDLWQTDRSLTGGAYLVCSPSSNIEAGTYYLKFDKPISLENLNIMFEPALEIRMNIILNGKEIGGLGELKNTDEGDKISINCKIYEFGTNNVIDTKLLPEGSSYSINVTENGSVIKSDTSAAMSIPEFELKNSETEIRATLSIKGFNPIELRANFTPTKYVPPPIVYTMSAERVGGDKSIMLKNLPKNDNLKIEFTVYADGKPITNPSEVKALNPQISVSPSGNTGKIEYSSDGKIVYMPNGTDSTITSGFFEVNVICNIAGVSASESYTVLASEYKLVSVNDNVPIKKTEFYENQTGVSFYITKDGKKLSAAEMEGTYTIETDGERKGVKLSVTVLEDGTIRCVPYSEKEFKTNALTWIILCNTKRYIFNLPGQDINVTINHTFGTDTQTIDITGESVAYQIKFIWLPVLLWVVAFFWVLACVLKPKFYKNTSVYIGKIVLRDNKYYMTLARHIPSKLYCKFRLIVPFLPIKVRIDSLYIVARQRGHIDCLTNKRKRKSQIKHFVTDLNSKSTNQDKSPGGIANRSKNKREEEIEKIHIPEDNSIITKAITDISQTNGNQYYVFKFQMAIHKINGQEQKVITSATIFNYS